MQIRAHSGPTCLTRHQTKCWGKTMWLLAAVVVLAKPGVAGSVPYIGQKKRWYKTKAWHPWNQERGKTNEQTGLAGQSELPLQRVQFKPAETTGEGFRFKHSCANAALHWAVQMKHLLKGMGLIFLAAQSCCLCCLQQCQSVSGGLVHWTSSQQQQESEQQLISHRPLSSSQCEARAGCVLQHSTAKLGYTPLALPRAPRSLQAQKL